MSEDAELTFLRLPSPDWPKEKETPKHQMNRIEMTTTEISFCIYFPKYAAYYLLIIGSIFDSRSVGERAQAMMTNGRRAGGELRS
jgi:hypothetical protein